MLLVWFTVPLIDWFYLTWQRLLYSIQCIFTFFINVPSIGVYFFKSMSPQCTFDVFRPFMYLTKNSNTHVFYGMF